MNILATLGLTLWDIDAVMIVNLFAKTLANAYW